MADKLSGNEGSNTKPAGSEDGSGDSEDKQTNMSFNYKIFTQPHKSKLLWIILLIIAAPFLYFWFQKGLDSTVNFIWNYVSLIFGASVILILILYGLFNDRSDPVEMEVRDELKRLKF